MNKTRIDAITGLRGLAALLVVYGHSVDWFSLPWKNHFSGEIGVASWLNYQFVERPGARLIKGIGNAFQRKFVPLRPLATSAQPLSVERDIR